MSLRPGGALASGNTFSFTTLIQSLPGFASIHHSHANASLRSTFHTSATNGGIHRNWRKKPRQRIDPYKQAQARQRKTANIARQRVLTEERRAAMGDPVRSTPTPFLESLKTPPSESLNHRLKVDDLNQSLERSRGLTIPPPPVNDNLEPIQESEEQLAIRQRQEAEMQVEHERAAKAMSIIASLGSGSAKNKQMESRYRIIEEFGRHNTDKTLPPRPKSADNHSDQNPLHIPGTNIPKRTGVDTGSSEVQIGLLTLKINQLADNVRMSKDKHNKRNLRLLVHRRQKLLAYMRRKERGGPRWQNLVEHLGINDAMWKGEISLA